ncbi:MAG: hypothetical protein QM723_26655 [Myxococcaceae bacterium]
MKKLLVAALFAFSFNAFAADPAPAKADDKAAAAKKDEKKDEKKADAKKDEKKDAAKADDKAAAPAKK